MAPPRSLLVLFWIPLVLGLGQSNVFGVFRKRKRVLLQIQDKRDEMLAKDTTTKKSTWETLLDCAWWNKSD